MDSVLKVVTSGDTVRLVGDLGSATAPALRQCIDRVTGPSTGELRVDVAGVGFVEPSGLAVFTEVTRRGHPVVLVEPRPQLRALVRSEGVADQIALEP